MEQSQKAALSVSEAAMFTGLSQNYIYKLICQRKIPFYKPTNGRVYFKKEELESFLFRGRQPADYEVVVHA